MGCNSVQIYYNDNRNMKRTHTKNLLSMAPTLNMFSNQKQSKLSTEQSLQASKPSSNIKYNRSISSFRKTNKESPQRKYNLYQNNKSRPTLPKSNYLEGNPYQKIVQILCYQINARSEQQIYSDFVQKIDGCLRVLENSMQSQTIIRVFREIKKYVSKIFGLIVKVTEKHVAGYIQQLQAVCGQYEMKIKQVQSKQKQRMRNKLLKAQAELAKKIQTIQSREIFSARIHNQMQLNNINLMNWIKQSQTFDIFVYNSQNYSSSVRTQSVIFNEPITMQKQTIEKTKEKYKQKQKQVKKQDNSAQKQKKQVRTQLQKGGGLGISNKPTVQIRIQEDLQFEDSMFEDYTKPKQKPIQRTVTVNQNIATINDWDDRKLNKSN